MSRTLAALAAAYVGRRVQLAPPRTGTGTVLRVTRHGFTIRTDTGHTLHRIRDDDIDAYLD